MAVPTIVQQFTNGVGSGTSVSVTYPSAQTKGNTNVLIVDWQNNSVSVSGVPTDTSLNTYTLFGTATFPSNSLETRLYICQSIKAAAAGTNAVLASLTGGTANQPEIFLLELSPCFADPAVILANFTASSGTPTVGPVTPQYDELMFCYATTGGGNSGAGAGWTALINAGTDVNGASTIASSLLEQQFAPKFVPTTGTVPSTGFNAWMNVIFGLRPLVQVPPTAQIVSAAAW